MTAPELLEEIEARGGSVAVARDATGVQRLKIVPRGLVPDLLPELAKFKPALLALLLESPDDAPSHRWESATGDDPTGPASAAATPTAPDESPDVRGDGSATTGSAPAAQAPEPTTAGDPTGDARKAAILRGETVVAHRRSSDDAKAKIDRDNDLIEWAIDLGLAQGIMRQNRFGNNKWASEWENPSTMKSANNGSDRDFVCDEFAVHLENSPHLRARLRELKGKVLVCCCHPQRCHGDLLARLANELPDVPAAPAMPDDLPMDATTAAAAILDGAYFNLARGGVWCIGWQQPSRAAWRYACTSAGGKLLGANRVPDMTPSASIDWAKQQQQNEVSA